MPRYEHRVFQPEELIAFGKRGYKHVSLPLYFAFFVYTPAFVPNADSEAGVVAFTRSDALAAQLHLNGVWEGIEAMAGAACLLVKPSGPQEHRLLRDVIEVEIETEEPDEAADDE